MARKRERRPSPPQPEQSSSSSRTSPQWYDDVPMVCWAPRDAPFPGDSNAKVRLPAGRFAAPALDAPRRRRAPPAEKPGPVGKGVTLLPNGWRIAPAGSHLDVGDLPLAMAIHPDGRHVVITNNGWSKPSLRVVDLERRTGDQKLALDHAWLGLAWHPDGKRLYLLGRGRQLDPRGGMARRPPGRRPHAHRLAAAGGARTSELINPGFMGGLAVSADGTTLYAAQVYGKAVVAARSREGQRSSHARSCPPRPTPPCSRRTSVRSTSRSGAPRRSPCSIARTPRPDRRDPRRRAPERDAVLEGRRSASSWPAPTPTRSGWSTWRRAARSSRSASRSHPWRPPGIDAERARALARRPDAAGRERRQQHGRGRGRHARRAQPRPGLHPDRLVPDRRRASSRDGENIYVL